MVKTSDRIIEDLEALDIFESGSLIYNQVPKPSCIFCSKVTGYLEITQSRESIFLLKILTMVNYFILLDKFYLQIKRCEECENKYNAIIKQERTSNL